MYLKGLFILLVCIGLGNAGKLSNYMKQNKANDEVTTKGTEYQSPEINEEEKEVTTSEKSLNLSENDSESMYGETTTVKGNKKQQIQNQETTTEKTEEKEHTSTEPSTEETPSKETQVDDTQEAVTEENETTATESTTEISQKESKPEKEISSKKPFIGKKCSFKQDDVEKSYTQWCDYFKKKNYLKLLKMYTKDGYVMVLGDSYHVHDPEEMKKLLAALNILESSFKVKSCEDFIISHTSTDCDQKTKTAAMNGKMKTVKFDPPITGSFKEILTEEEGQLKIYSQELEISDERK